MGLFVFFIWLVWAKIIEVYIFNGWDLRENLKEHLLQVRNLSEMMNES